MTEEINDDTEFIQQDFTTASEWEIFNARLEEQFHEWKLPFMEAGPLLAHDQLSLCDWQVTQETVNLGELALTLTRYRCNIPAEVALTTEETRPQSTAVDQPMAQAFMDLMSTTNNFWLSDYKSDSAVHPLARWFGLRDFVVVAPVHFIKSIFKADYIPALLSSIHIAVAESNCEVPVFLHGIQGGHVYSGVCESGSTRLSYDIVNLRNAPVSYKYLTGLLNLFKQKVVVKYVNPVRVSVRLTYSLKNFPDNSATMAADLEFEDVDEDPVKMLFKLTPFRVSLDPLNELLLFCGWPEINEDCVTDAQHFSDIAPDTAPAWSIRARFDDRAICHMSDCIGEYLKLHADPRTLANLLGNGFNMLGDEAERNPFELLTESKISTVLPSFVGGKASSSANKNKPSAGPTKLDGPLEEEQLMQMLYYMFPDAQAMSTHQYEMPENDPVS